MTNQEIFGIVMLFMFLSLGMHLLYILWFLNKIDNGKDFLISPATLHRLTKMNWVGCIIYWVIGLVLAPLFTIIGIFAWLFTVGRRD